MGVFETVVKTLKVPNEREGFTFEFGVLPLDLFIISEVDVSYEDDEDGDKKLLMDKVMVDLQQIANDCAVNREILRIWANAESP